MSRLVPDTLAGRTIVILVIGLGLFHLWSIWIYRIGSENLLGSGREPELADRIVSLALALNELPPEDREEGAHALSAPDLSVHWSPESLIGDEAANDERAALLRRRLAQIAPNLKVDALRFGFTGDAARHARMLLASVRLPDGSWVTFSPDPFSQTSAAEHDVLGSLTAMALGILVVSVLLVRSITAPLRTLADAADRIGTGIDAHQAPETGPREIRRVARAFNEMQARIRRLVSDRTQTLAAVSHDLKTPLTRLRLRSEFVEDRALRRMIDADLEEMEHMLDSALAFLRDDVTGEEGKMVDIGSILETICDEAADAGRDVVRVGPDHATLLCRPLAVKRAFSNLIDNAVKYGARARVSLEDGPERILVTIEDDGPGIPAGERERVFDPFYRLEGSRSRETGGTGLGLTVARTVVHAHGGEIDLRDAPDGGLQVAVTCPRRRRAVPAATLLHRAAKRRTRPDATVWHGPPDRGRVLGSASMQSDRSPLPGRAGSVPGALAAAIVLVSTAACAVDRNRDYRIEVINQPVPVGSRSELDVKLTRAPDGQPVENATITRAGLCPGRPRNDHAAQSTHAGGSALPR